MEENKKIPGIVQLGAWFLSLIVFAVGFWHTHLGLKEMRPFGSEYGSIAIAAIILLLLIITYWFAVNGRKMALIFYVICGLFFFIFNLNYFYPAYMARELVKEEAIALNDTLQKFTNKSQSYFNSETIEELTNLNTLKKQLVDEVKNQTGWGPRATDYLNQFNFITSGNQKPNNSLGASQDDRDKIAERYAVLLEEQIDGFILRKVANNKIGNPKTILDGISDLNDVKQNYTEKLKLIIEDDSEIQLDSLINLRQKGDNHPQIKVLQNLVTDIDNATKKINEGNKEEIYPILKEAQTRNLGRIKHTVGSVSKRISETDTLGIILVCLFIDLLVPLAIYLLLRKKEGDNDDDSSSASGPDSF